VSKRKIGHSRSVHVIIDSHSLAVAEETKSTAYLRQGMSYQYRDMNPYPDPYPYADPWSGSPPKFNRLSIGPKTSCKSVRKFLHKVANKQTNIQSNNDENITFLAGIIIQETPRGRPRKHWRDEVDQFQGLAVKETSVEREQHGRNTDVTCNCRRRKSTTSDWLSMRTPVLNVTELSVQAAYT